MSDKKENRGGARNGAGAKPLHGKAMRGVTVYMTDAQRETYAEIGGGAEIRAYLDLRANGSNVIPN